MIKRLLESVLHRSNYLTNKLYSGEGHIFVLHRILPMEEKSKYKYNFSLAITFVSLFTIPFGWIMPELKDLMLLSLIGVFGGFANLWLGQSYKLSEVSLVTPLKYLALVFAIIFGYFIWDEVPTFKTLLGAGLVILSSFIIFRRELVLKKRLSVSRHE